MLIFFLFLVPVFYLFFILRNKFTSSKLQPPLPPGPTPLPYIGCLISLLRNKPTFRWIHRMMDEMNTKILCIRVGNTHIISVSDPKIALEILKDTDRIFSSRPESMSASLASDGYLNVALSPMGDQWKKMKKVLSREILSAARHKWLLNKRNEEIDHILRYINNQCETNLGATRGFVNVRVIGQQYSSNMVRKLIFGSRYYGKGSADGGPGEEEIEHVNSLSTMLVHIYAFIMSDYFPWLRWKTDFDGHEKIIRNAILTSRKYQDPLIDERIEQWKNGVRTKEDDLLDVFINLDDPRLNADEIKSQILDLNLAAYVNISSNIEWVMAEMMNQPRIFDKAVKELDLVVGKERLVLESDLPNLNYIRACVKEALRLHPVTSFNLPHVTTADSTVGGYFIPKGSHVMVSRIGINRDPEAWDDPLTFTPERHIDGDKEVVLTHSLNMFTFSTGLRGCSGMLLGSTMTMMLLARLVQGFTWELPPNEPHVDLKENLNDIGKAKTLVVLAKPRLPHHIYPTVDYDGNASS